MNTSTTAATTLYTPATASEVQELVKSLPKVLPTGALTKPPLSRLDSGQEVTRMAMTQITGIIEYEPGEYTFTAYAGTRLSEIAAALAEHGQYMPFDPPLVDAGATLGGTIAAGISGSERYRYGGLRDFILGVQLVDGQGRLIRGGGKVVKNAAGFDIPKLMVGSMGRLGILISATFKVFPAPPATATLRVTLPTLADALGALARLMGGPFDLEALDLLPQNDGTVTLLTRIGGPADVLDARLDRLRTLVGNGESVMDDKALWAEAREFTWVPGSSLLVKTATTPQTLPELDRALHAAKVARRYAVGGNLVWFAWPDSLLSCHQMLTELGIYALVLRGNAERALIGMSLSTNFLNRVRSALDPAHCFVDFE
jgi:glycolate oxidase FAD binding subunit